MAAMAVMAVIVFSALFFFKAGYGYLGGGNWGPRICNRLAWVMMEAPAFILMLCYVLTWGRGMTVPCVIAGFFLLHYFQRSFIFPLLIRGNSKMPLSIVAMGVLFNAINTYLIAGWLFKYAPDGYYTARWLCSPQFIAGAVVFFVGMGINIHSDHVIRSLRKPGDTGHHIPLGGMYRYVTSANYFGEIVEWTGFAILSWSPTGLLFVVWTFANLAPRSKSLSEKYIQEFGDEYRSLNKKNLIPKIW